MKIAFVTTQSPVQSTLIGRIFPIAHELAQKNQVTVLVHEEQDAAPSSEKQNTSSVEIISIGTNPFSRTSAGKNRLRGFPLLVHMAANAIRACRTIIRLQPDCIVIVKTLPENVLAVWLARFFLKKTRIIIDVDDFELLANKLTSLVDRFAIHTSERVACWMTDVCIVATPFLEDHTRALVGQRKKITLIPTGYTFTGQPITLAPTPTILYIGSVSNSSGHHVAILPEVLFQVRKTIPDARLLIAGSGDDEESLKKEFEAQGLADAVSWLGRFTDADIPRIISQSAVLIDPIDGSIVSRAKSSYRVMLACAVGIPVVTSNIGIRPSIIPSQFHDRFFALPDNAASYAEKTHALLISPLSKEERTQLLHEADQYTYKKLAELYYTSCI